MIAWPNEEAKGEIAEGEKSQLASPLGHAMLIHTAPFCMASSKPEGASPLAAPQARFMVLTCVLELML